ncbi:MAG: outer membrane protein assembly factor BamE [Burkholderiales bacterium]
MSWLTGCSGVPAVPGIGPYKIDVQQGNYVNQEMVARLKPGMTRSQVRFVLGTPLVVDVFRTNRWDYVYVYEKAGKLAEHRKLTVIFEDDKLARIEGDVVAAKSAAAAPEAAGNDKKTGAADEPQKAAAPVAAGTAAAGKPQEEQQERGFFGRLLDRIGF